MQISTSSQPPLMQPVVTTAPAAPAEAPAPSAADPGVAAADTVEISPDAAEANAGRVNPRGKATGHARVAQNIEKNVAKLIERESARVAAAGGDASSFDTFRAQVEGIAAAYTTDPSGSPAKVLSEVHAAVKALRAAQDGPADPTGEPPAAPPVDAEEPGAEVPAESGTIADDLSPIPDGAAPMDDLPPAPATGPITADLSGLRLL